MTMINDSHCHFFSSSFLEKLAPSGGGAAASAERLAADGPGSVTQLAGRFVIEPLALAMVALCFQKVPVIIADCGAGFLREALMAADQCPTIHLDSSSSNSWTKFHPGLALEEVFWQALTVAGADRILFGTDSSYFPRGWQRDIYESQQRTLEKLGVGAADQEKIFGGNFDRLLPQ